MLIRPALDRGLIHPTPLDYICRLLFSLNERMAGRPGLQLPAWRNDYLIDYRIPPDDADDAEGDDD